MARIRSVHPSLFTDESWVSCSPLARILYIGLWTDADDQGAFEWKPLQIKMRLLPGDAGDAASMLAELEEGGLIRAYQAEGKRYGAIANFRKFQRPKKPNAVHPITPEIADYVCLSDTGSEPVPHSGATDGEKAPQMEDGGEEVEVGSVATAPDLAPNGACPPKPDLLPVQQAFDEWNSLAARLALPIAKNLDDARRRKIRARLKSSGGIEGWREALAAVEASPHCRGENDRGWRADIDFLFQATSWNRLIEGYYRPKSKPGQGPPVASDPAILARHQALLNRTPAHVG